MDLFNQEPANRELLQEPLAFRMRPRTLDEFVGQDHILARGRLLRRAIQADQLSSLIFYGPPGCGKTTLARVIAGSTKAAFHSINAVLAGVSDIRDAIKHAQTIRRRDNRKYILFIDEVHRFNKAQQDALLPHVENGVLILVGATTENPYFEVNKPLVSRSRIFQFLPLENRDLLNIARAALADKERGYGNKNIDVETQALEHIVKVANGDARAVLNALELAVETSTEEAGSLHISTKDAEESIQRRAVLYDRDGDAHYDTISAFIKSVRGSDPDAALYWLAKMVYAGEDPRFIFRRMLILASEDVGLADPDALRVVVSASQAYDYVGLPEGKFHLAQACLYLATAPKSNSTMAFFDALGEVEKSEKGHMPDHLKDSSRDKDGFGHGKGYLYPHAYRDHWVAQQYLPASLQGKVFYKPSKTGFEKTIVSEVNRRRELQFAALLDPGYGFDIVEPIRVKKDDFWFRRSLAHTSEMLDRVRTEVFRLLKCSPEDLALDLSGGKGFLTWEACLRCDRGGVWSRCADDQEHRRMRDWVGHFEFMLQPHLFHMSLEAPAGTALKEDGEYIQFDVVIGHDLFKHNEGRDALKTIGLIRDQNLSQKATMVFSQTDYRKTQSFYELLMHCCGKSGPSQEIPAKLLEKVQSVEKYFKSGSILGKSSSIREQLSSLGFNHVEIFNQEFSARRHLLRKQIIQWFKVEKTNQPDGLLAEIRNNVSDKEWSHLRNIMLEELAGKDVPWKQGYTFWRIKK
ncbi:AAA family ATPase [Fibrobacterota bacterium]